jgi:hypothetical protein
MEIKTVATLITNNVYLVTDKEGKSRIYHDPVAAQSFEDKVKRESAEAAKKE